MHFTLCSLHIKRIVQNFPLWSKIGKWNCFDSERQREYATRIEDT